MFDKRLVETGDILVLLRSDQIRSDDWVEALPSQRRLQFLSSYVLVLVSSKNFYHHQVQLSGNFRFNLSIVIILSSFEVVFFHMENSNSFFSSMSSVLNRKCPKMSSHCTCVN